MTTKTKKAKDQVPESLDIGIMNGQIAADFYQKSPCTVGYAYSRIEVTGAVRGCCIAKFALGDTSKNKWQEVWNGNQFQAFREKTATIHKTHMHLKDPEWGFCQQCSHRQINVERTELLQVPFDEED